MEHIPTSAMAIVVYAVIGLVAVLFVSFMVNPKRTRKTVDYMVNSYRAWRLAKTVNDPTVKIEVPDFETKALPKVPDPRPKGKRPSK